MPLHRPKEKEKKRKIKLLVFKRPITLGVGNDHQVFGGED